ncbi:C2 domain-containing protein 2-like isoform X1 [Branchiostoma lanceolatum]|uniref:C2 domain-containing protein 2-like isoform X1 n=1 Tax=Branchiostoma lanceolatum TaxID=7740 RepID=UPI00345623FA
MPSATAAGGLSYLLLLGQSMFSADALVKNVNSGKLDVLDVFLVLFGVFLSTVLVVTSVWTSLRRRWRGEVSPPGRAASTGTEQEAGVRFPASDGRRYEPCEWVNTTLTWLRTQQHQTPELVKSWLKALNEQARRNGSSLQLTFDKIKEGSLPPKFTTINSRIADDGSLVIGCYVEWLRLGLTVFATQQTPQTIKLAICDVDVKLTGECQFKASVQSEEVHVTGSFPKEPKIDLNVKQPAGSEEDGVDTGIVEGLVRDTLAGALLTISLSLQSMLREERDQPDRLPTFVDGPISAPGDRGVAKPIVTRRLSPSGVPPKPPRLQDRKLLVKVIKANGLPGRNGFGSCDPYCIIEMDAPLQKHKTSVIKNTINPFWDEHFLFDLSTRTKELKFSLFDREKGSDNNDLLGEAVIPMDTLTQNLSSRQIIPLQRALSTDDGVNASVTAEFLFMEPSAAQQALNSLHPQPSPIRPAFPTTPQKKVETYRTVTPGGTVITTQTTTVERAANDRSTPGSVHESPVQQKKYENELEVMDEPGRLSVPTQTLSASQELLMIDGVDSVAETAIRQLREMSQQRSKTPTKTSTLIITGVSREEMENEDMMLEASDKNKPASMTDLSPTGLGALVGPGSEGYISGDISDKSSDKQSQPGTSEHDSPAQDSGKTLLSGVLKRATAARSSLSFLRGRKKPNKAVPSSDEALMLQAGATASRRRFFRRKERPHSSHSDLLEAQQTEESASVEIGPKITRETKAKSKSYEQLVSKSETSSLRSYGARASTYSYGSARYSGISTSGNLEDMSITVLETKKKGQIRHYLIPPELARRRTLRRRGKKLHVHNDHSFIAKHFKGVPRCAVCDMAIARRIGKQGYECRDCKLICHKECHFKTELYCPNSRVGQMEITC